MCGVAGFSLHGDASVEPSLLAKLLMAGLAERGEDASGYAYRDSSGGVHVLKRAMPIHKFLPQIALPSGTQQALMHIRDHTKGTPSIEANNHPIRHGRVCGVHNGIIQNDDELFTAFEHTRALPGMSVDSEAIFMLLDTLPNHVDAFQHLVGSYSIGFFDDRDPEHIHLVRGEGRPLVLGMGQGMAIFASTSHALEFAADRLELALQIEAVETGTMMSLSHGRVVARRDFDVTPFTEESTARYSREGKLAQLARQLVDREHGPPLEA